MSEQRSIVCNQTALFAWNIMPRFTIIITDTFSFLLSSNFSLNLLRVIRHTRKRGCQQSIIPIKRGDKWLVLYYQLKLLGNINLPFQSWKAVGGFLSRFWFQQNLNVEQRLITRISNFNQLGSETKSCPQHSLGKVLSGMGGYNQLTIVDKRIILG